MPRALQWEKAGQYFAPKDGVMVYAPKHPRARSNGYVPEHVLVAERALGKPLTKNHPVHHVDGDKRRNVAGNLVVCEDQGYHMALHRRQRAFNACGDPNALRCSYCRSYDRQDEMVAGPRRLGAYHRSCGTRYEYARRHPELRDA